MWLHTLGDTVDQSESDLVEQFWVMQCRLGQKVKAGVKKKTVF